MKIVLTTFALATSIVAPSSAAISSLPAEFSQVAKAVALADTCQALGYSVDRDGIVKFSNQVKYDALDKGLSATEAKKQLSLAIERELHREAERYARAEIMSHSLPNVERHNRGLQKRCKRLSDNPNTASFFVLAHSD